MFIVRDNGNAVKQTFVAIADVGDGQPHAGNMDKAILIVGIAGQGSVKGVIGLRGDERAAVLVEADEEQGMIPAFVLTVQLDDVARLRLLERYLPSEGTGPHVGGEEVVEKFHPRPGGAPIRLGQVIPAVDRGIIHGAAPGVDALGDEVGAVAAAPGIIHEQGVAAECPFARIGDCPLPKVGLGHKHLFFSFRTVHFSLCCRKSIRHKGKTENRLARVRI